MGSFGSIDAEGYELDRVAACGQPEGRWFSRVMLVDGNGMPHGNMGKRFCSSRKCAHDAIANAY